VFLLPAIIVVVIRITTLLPPSFSLLSATRAHSIVFFRGVLIARIFSTLLSQVSIPLLVHNSPWNRPIFLPSSRLQSIYLPTPPPQTRLLLLASLLLFSRLPSRRSFFAASLQLQPPVVVVVVDLGCFSFYPFPYPTTGSLCMRLWKTLCLLACLLWCHSF
jgi:hypothetical protein